MAILADLVQAVQAAGIYPEDHHRVQEPLSRLHRRVKTEAKRLRGLTIGFLGDQVVIDQFPFRSSTRGFERLTRRMAARGIEKVAIDEAITLQEMLRFVRYVAGPATAPPDGPWRSVAFGKIQGLDEAPPLPPARDAELSAPQVLDGAAAVLKDLLQSLSRDSRGRDVEDGRDIVASVMKGLREEEFLIDRMMRMQSRDDYTVAHSLNVCVLVVAQARRAGLSEPVLRDVGLAALLHDVGKELIPAGILAKPGKLDEGEFATVSLHPALGATHLRKLSLGTDLPMIVSFEHHMRYDRTGYPEARFPDPLHPASLMTQVADVYDALRTYRPYREKFDKETALSILADGRGTEFDPRFLDDFVAMVSAES
jgi:hypothetical protein